MSEIIAISYPSALAFWLDGTEKNLEKYSLKNRTLANLSSEFDVPSFSTLVNEISYCLNLPTPISFMVSSSIKRRKGKLYKCCVRPNELPENSFVKVDTSLFPALGMYEVYIASPEYCFLCAAKEYSLCKLTELGFNLCATYTKDSKYTYGQRAIKPLMTKKSLQEYLDSCKWMKHTDFALRATRYIADESYSPMESKLGTMACLSKYGGGYGLIFPKMNGEVMLCEAAAKFLQRESVKCDLVWENEKVIVEYDSNMTHLNESQHSYDKKKIRALQMSGYKVFPVVSSDLTSMESIDKLFFAIRKELKMGKKEKWFKKYYGQRESNCRELFQIKI